MFFGQFLHTVDEKGRVAIPRELRRHIPERELDGGLYLMPGPDASLALMTQTEYERHERRLRGFSGGEHREALRFLRAHTVVLPLDGQGRVLLPERSMQALKLPRGNTEVMILGNDRWMEVRSPAEWSARQKPAAEQFGKMGFLLFEEHSDGPSADHAADRGLDSDDQSSPFSGKGGSGTP
ncbi:MAG: hypothetical protein HY719_11085 [Planctomycetes bacterium]|nr:hypothetical protein [Planctomycetota bacterium]